MRRLLPVLAILVLALGGCFPEETGEGKVMNDVNTDLRITSGALPQGTITFAYNHTMTALGGELPYHWTANGLPAGLSIHPDTGAISGTPQVAGIYTVTFLCVESSLLQVVASRDYQLVVNEPVVPLGG